jgi:hypothetical protein
MDCIPVIELFFRVLGQFESPERFFAKGMDLRRGGG